jgi:tetratricopeptide (TPR) repeat protein
MAGKNLPATLALALVLPLTAACPAPQIVRVPVQPADVIRANEAARDGDMAFARKDYYAALIKYLDASRANPNSEYIYNKLGITYSQLKYYREAADAFRRSIGLNPKYAYSHNNLGSVYFATDDKKNAERSFKKAISLSPNVASFHINLGSLYFERKKMDRGMAEWRKGLELDGDILQRSEGVSLVAAGSRGAKSDRNYFMARLFASVGDAERAVDSLQQALNAGFSDIDAIEKEKDFDPIREHEKFKTFMKTAVLLSRR